MNENIPAFPIKGAVCEYQFTGMTLRDWFAGMALQGIYNTCERQPCGFHDAHEYRLAVSAYKMADAMLNARDQ